MIRLAVAAALLLAAHPQETEEDFTARVGGLVAQLKESATRKKAEAELLKIGPRALPLVRKAHGQAEGEFKTKLEVVLRSLESSERRQRAQGKFMSVKIAAKDQPLSELAASLTAATGVPIDLQGEAAGAAVTLEAASISLWEALDKLCKGHGRLTWDVSDKGVAVRDGTNEPGLRAFVPGYVLILREFDRRSSEGGRRDTINSSAYVAGPPGSVMICGHITFQALVDDRGTNLMKSPGPTGTASIGGFDILDNPDPARPLYQSLRDLQDPTPAKDATKVKVCRGVAYARMVVDSRKGVEIKGAAIKAGGKASAPGIESKLVEVSIADRDIQMVVEVTDSNIAVKKDRNALYPETGGRVILRDSRGIDIGASLDKDTGTTTMSGPAMSFEKETTRFKVKGTLADGISLSSIEVWEPSDIEEIKIPFDLKDIPIRKTK